MNTKNVSRKSLVNLSVIIIASVACLLGAGAIAYDLTNTGMILTGYKPQTIHDVLWWHIAFIPSLTYGIQLSTLALAGLIVVRKKLPLSPRQFVGVSMIVLALTMGVGVGTIPLVQASIATGNYYLDTPLPIASYFVGQYSDNTYFSINGSNWRNFLVNANSTYVEQMVLGNTTSGIVWLSDMRHNYSLSIPTNVVVEEHFNGQTRKFASDVGNSPFSVSVDDVVSGYYLAEDDGDVIFTASTNASVVFQSVLDASKNGVAKIVFGGGIFYFNYDVRYYEDNTIILEGAGSRISRYAPTTDLGSTILYFNRSNFVDEQNAAWNDGYTTLVLKDIGFVFDAKTENPASGKGFWKGKVTLPDFTNVNILVKGNYTNSAEILFGRGVGAVGRTAVWRNVVLDFQLLAGAYVTGCRINYDTFLWEGGSILTNLGSATYDTRLIRIETSMGGRVSTISVFRDDTDHVKYFWLTPDNWNLPYIFEGVTFYDGNATTYANVLAHFVSSEGIATVKLINTFSASGNALKMTNVVNVATETATYVVETDGTNYWATRDDGWVIKSTNASYVFQTTINALPSGGGKISVKAGLYLLDTTLTGLEGRVIEGEGFGESTILQLTASVNMFNISGQASGAKYTIIRDLTLDGNDYNAYGIYAYSASWIPSMLRLETLRIRNFGKSNVYLSGVAGVFMSGCRIYGAGEHGVYVSSSDNTFIQSYIAQSGGVNLYVLGDNNEFIDIHVWSGGLKDGNQPYGIRVNGKRNMFVAVHSEMNTRIGMLIEGSANTVTGSNFWGNGNATFTNGRGIVLNNAVNNTLIGNSVSDVKGYHEYSIREQGTSNYNVIIGNVLIGANIAEISKVGANTIVKDNIGFVTESSGTFTSISNGTYVAHSLAGTPNIVSITLSVQGYAWLGASNSTHFQIYASVATVSGSWYAEYKP